MAQIIELPSSPSSCEKECIKALRLAQMAAAEAVGVLEKFMRDDTLNPQHRIDAIRTLLYYGLEMELTNNG